METRHTLKIELPLNALGGLLPLLGQGVQLQVPVEINLEALLCDYLKVPREYLRDRIQTIFLNGRAVDREDQALVADGAVVALSAAMPGLAGATLRKGGHLAGMRSEISQGSDLPAHAGSHQGRITLKLFNVIAREMGPGILAQGIHTSGDQLADILKTVTAPDLSDAVRMHWDDRAIAAGQVSDLLASNDPILLRVVVFDSAETT
jgi:hypothetical protein